MECGRILERAQRVGRLSTLRLSFPTTTLPAAIRGFVRSRASGLVLTGVVVGALSGALVVIVSATVQFMHVTLFGLPPT